MRIMTFNTTGLGQGKPEYLLEVLTSERIDIILLQETWLLPGNVNRLSNISDQYMSFGISSIRNTEILQGRPYGGLGVLWHKSLAGQVQIAKLKQCTSNRLCAMEIKTDNEMYMLLNVYLPNDNMHKSHVNEEFLAVCDEIELVINQYSNHRIIICGDLNVDFSRNNAHDLYVRNLLERYDLELTWNKFPGNMSHTYSNELCNIYSCLDHFCVTKCIMRHVNNVYVYDNPLNPPGHRPVVMDITVNTQRITVDTCAQQRDSIAWHKVTDQHIAFFQAEIDKRMQQLPTLDGLLCRDINCDNESHKSDIDQYCTCLVDICLQSDHMFPRNSWKPKHGFIPGWTDQVKPYRQEYLGWYHIWKDLGKPNHGLAYDNMRDSRRQYFYAIRRCKRREKQTRMNKMAEQLSANKSRDFYKEVKKLNYSKKTSPCINGEVNNKDISRIFCDKYKELYNSVQSDAGNIAEIRDYIANIRPTANSAAIIDKQYVMDALAKLKSGKSDGDKGLISDHILYASQLYYDQLTMMVTAIFMHGHQPKYLVQSTITSIPKDNKGDLCDDNNYRGITLTSCLAKLIDWIILMRNKEKLNTSGLQFAFKEKHSTVMCTLMLKEIIQYYLNHNSTVSACFIDSSKAFDRVRHDKLFMLLMERGMAPVDLRVMFDLYNRQLMRAEWHGSYSEYFHSSNGIRQGSVISPVLYCIYMDVLIKRLHADGIGCWIGHRYYGCLSYADDMTLLCPTTSGLQRMIRNCEQYGQQYDVLYNAKKTFCILFSRRGLQNRTSIYLQGSELQWTDNAKYLGSYVSNDLTETKEIQMKRGDLAGRVNTLLSNFRDASPEVLSAIFNTQCCHLYGVQCWALTDPNINNFVVMWNRSVRKVLGLPWRAHNRYLGPLIGAPHVLDQIFQRFVGMLNVMLNSDNKQVEYLARHSFASPGSIISKNVQYIASMIKCNYHDVLRMKLFAKRFELSDTDNANIKTIKELIFDILPNFLNFDDINTIYKFLSCN